MGRLTALTDEARRQATEAEAELKESLALDGVVFPSLAVDFAGVVTGVILLDLGRVRPDVAVHIAGLVRDGVKYRAQQSC